MFLVSALAYFVGAWLFAAIFIFQRYEDRDQRFFVIFLLMPIMYVCFTILLLLFNKHIRLFIIEGVGVVCGVRRVVAG